MTTKHYTVEDQANHNEVSKGYIHILIKFREFPEPDELIGKQKTKIWNQLHKIQRKK